MLTKEGRPLLATGVPGLDALLGGGIPERQMLIVCGQPGSGKTLLCSHVAFSLARAGVPVVIGTVTSEPHDKLVGELAGFSFFDRGLVGEEVFLLSTFPWLKKGPKQARELLLKTVADRKARLLFVDGLRALRDLWRDEAALREFLYELGVGLAASGCVALFTTEYDVRTLMGHPEATTADGIISLLVRPTEARRSRRIEVVKLRGRAHLPGEHPFRIGADGARVLPRLETITPADVDFRPSPRRLAFGVPALDQMLRGGLPERSTSLMAGSTGIGKTLLAATWVAEGASRGEPAVFVTYSEPPLRLVERAEAVGIRLREPIEKGLVRVVYRPTGEAEADDLVEEVLGEVSALGPCRLVVDGIGGLEESVTEPSRTRRLLASLLVRLRTQGVTSVFIKEVSTIAGPQLDFSDAPIAVTAENMLFLRHVEMRGRLHRIVSVLKMRESDYDEHVREFRISTHGFEILEPIRSVHGLLTGMAAPVLGDARQERA